MSHHSCCRDESCCSCSKCTCSCHAHEHDSCHEKEGSCTFSQELIELADEAWMDVLKEKMMDRIRAKSEMLDSIADLVCTTNNNRWKMKMEQKNCCHDFESKLKQIFSPSCSNGSCETKKK